MRRPVVAIVCRNHELSEKLEESIAALESGGRFVDPATLPGEAALNAVHAQLSRVCRGEFPRRTDCQSDSFSST